MPMRLDHVSYAAEKDGLVATAERLAEQLGAPVLKGGVHPTFGTRNMIIPLAHERYLEVIEPLDHPVTDKVPFGQAVKAAVERGGGWMGWMVSVDDLDAHARRLFREPTDGHRVFPDGRRLEWRQIGVNRLLNDPQLPIILEWQTPELHVGKAFGDVPVSIAKMTIAGDPQRVHDWLDTEADSTSTVVDFEFVAPKGNPGIMSVTFDTASGEVTI